METNTINNDNQDTFKFNTITEYLEKKCAEDEKFKEQLKEMIDLAEKNYQELDKFLKENKIVIFERKIKLGLELLEKNETLIQNFASIIDPNELDIFEQFNQYKKKIDPIFIKVQELKKKIKGELIDELEDIKKNIEEIKEKMEIKKIILKKINLKDKNIKREKNLSKKNNCKKIFQQKIFDENKIDENIINLDESNESNELNEESKGFILDFDSKDNKETQFLYNEINYLKKQYISLLDDKSAIHIRIKKLQTEIILLKNENPLNKLDKYDKLVVMYFNKIHIFQQFLTKISTKLFCKKSKHPRFK